MRPPTRFRRPVGLRCAPQGRRCRREASSTTKARPGAPPHNGQGHTRSFGDRDACKTAESRAARRWAYARLTFVGISGVCALAAVAAGLGLAVASVCAAGVVHVLAPHAREFCASAAALEGIPTPMSRGRTCSSGASTSAPSGADADARLPVTVVTGFLGSGKTLINRILREEHGLRILVVENELKTGIDGGLMVERGLGPERLIELNNGCLCCTVRGDLSDALARLADGPQYASLDAVVVETTGLRRRARSFRPSWRTRQSGVCTVWTASLPCWTASTSDSSSARARSAATTGAPPRIARARRLRRRAESPPGTASSRGRDSAKGGRRAGGSAEATLRARAGLQTPPPRAQPPRRPAKRRPAKAAATAAAAAAARRLARAAWGGPRSLCPDGGGRARRGGVGAHEQIAFADRCLLNKMDCPRRSGLGRRRRPVARLARL